MGFIMYSAHMLQVHQIIKNLVRSIERDNGGTIETAINSKVAFQNEDYRRAFYKTYKRDYETQRISHNHRKVPNIYCAPKYRNLLAINLLSAFSSDPDKKYLTAGTQQ